MKAQQSYQLLVCYVPPLEDVKLTWSIQIQPIEGKDTP